MRTATVPRTALALATLVIVLSLTTGIALARLVFDAPNKPSSSPTTGPEVMLVQRFYAAVNESLQTGNTDELVDIVAEDIVEHPIRAGTSPGRAGLVETVTALRATFPNLHLVFEELRAAGNQVTARVRVEGSNGGFLGIPIDVSRAPWGPIDLFRIEGGVVVEHWGVPPADALFVPLSQAPISVPNDPRRSIALERREFAPDATWSGEVTGGPVVIIGQSGSMTVSVDGSDTPALLVHKPLPGGTQASEPIGDGVIATLVPGDLLVLPQATRFTAGNWGPAVAAILLLTLDVPAVPGGAQTADALPPGGVTRSPQALGPAAAISPSAVVRVGRMTLGPGTELPSHPAAGPELLVVEGGTLVLTADQELAWVRHGSDPESSGTHLASVEMGDGATVSPGAVATYRNASQAPVTVLLLTILPAG